MNERHQPYVGVSGVVNAEQHRALAESSVDTLADVGRRLLIGIKATHKTLMLEEENKYGPNWYPVGEHIGGTLDDSIRHKTFNVAQIYLEKSEAIISPTYAEAFISKLNEVTYPQLDGIQVDSLEYPLNPEYFQHVVNAIGHHAAILQCHKEAMSVGPAKAIDALKRVTDVHPAHYILFDASHGTGKTMDPNALLPFLKAAYDDATFESQGVNFGIAGGLDALNIDRMLRPVLHEFPQVSWDAEGKLHDRTEEGGDGSLNMDRVQRYLGASVQMLQDLR